MAILARVLDPEVESDRTGYNLVQSWCRNGTPPTGLCNVFMCMLVELHEVQPDQTHYEHWSLESFRESYLRMTYTYHKRYAAHYTHVHMCPTDFSSNL